MIRSFLFFLVLSVLPCNVFAQNDSNVILIDSLQGFITTAKKQTKLYKIKESLETAMQLVAHATSLENEHYKAHAYYLIGHNFNVLSDFQDAEGNFKKSLEYALTANDSLLILNNYIGLGVISVQGYKDLHKGLDYFKKATDLAEQTNAAKEYMSAGIKLASTYLDLNQPEMIVPYMDKLEKLVLGTRSIEGYVQLSILMGKRSLDQNNVVEAESYFNTAIVMAEPHNMISELSDIYKSKYTLYEAKGDTVAAFKNLKKYHQNNDRLVDKEKRKQIELAKISFDVRRYKEELKMAKERTVYQKEIADTNRVVSIISILGSTALLILIFFIYKGFLSIKRLNGILKRRNKELFEAKSKAEEFANVKSQFISTVSHELRTPLYGVVGITTLLLEDNSIQKKHKKLLGSLKFSGDYLLNLVNNVLQISKIESKKVELKESPTNLLKLAQNLFVTFDYQAKSKGNELILDVDSNLPNSLSLDSLRFSEILINLIGNASKFTEKGKIWLRILVVHQEEDHVTIRVEVEDSGKGIPEDKKEFIFQKFTQLNRETNEVEGTGLGLSIVRNLLELMDSEIHLESQEGKGTKFTFDLTLNILEDAVENTTEEVENKIPQDQVKILVAEDNKINQIVTKNLLNLIGYNSIIVENGFNAVQALKKEDFDLILMDLNMPYMDGFEATIKIRNFNTEIPIIALTASEIDEVKEDCMAIGMHGIINKPLNKNDLKNIIEEHLLTIQ